MASRLRLMKARLCNSPPTASDPDNSGGPYTWFIHTQTFTNLTLDPWTAYSRASNKDWVAKHFGTERYYAQLNGVNADVPSDDWLISPRLDFSGTSAQTLSFETAKINGGPDLETLISTNYSGTGDPANATWTALSATLSTGNEDVVPSGLIDLSVYAGAPSVYISFRYTSTGTTSSTAAIWEVGDIKILATFPTLAQQLTFTLGSGAPAGLIIDPATGVFSWTPTEADGPGVYPITVRVTDDGAPNGTPLSASRVLNVTVNEVNLPPSLDPINNLQANELATLTFTASASDPDLPANALTYTLDSGAPAGATIDPTTGLFMWTPTELDGPGSYPITVRVTDSSPQAVNTNQLSDTTSFTVSVNEVNAAPSLTVPT